MYREFTFICCFITEMKPVTTKSLQQFAHSN